MQTATKKTENIIYEMLTENTGGSILDSGGAYGRHWQRNQLKTLEDFKSEPSAWIDAEWSGVYKSLFWHLVDNLTPDEPLNAHFDKFAELNPDEGYFELMELWLDALGVEPEGQSDIYKGRWVFNSYNFDGCLLSQDIQAAFFDLNGNDYIILQVHGGCDARGGYTKPRVFSLGYEGRDGFILNTQSAYFICNGPECGNRLSVDYCSLELSDEDGNELDTPKDIEDIAVCTCGGAWVA
jgi:hypothetical protein